MRRQLQSLLSAGPDFSVMGGPWPGRLCPETGPEEIRDLSRGFNQLASNLEALESDRRLMLVGISHDFVDAAHSPAPCRRTDADENPT